MILLFKIEIMKIKFCCILFNNPSSPLPPRLVYLISGSAAALVRNSSPSLVCTLYVGGMCMTNLEMGGVPVALIVLRWCSDDQIWSGAAVELFGVRKGSKRREGKGRECEEG